MGTTSFTADLQREWRSHRQKMIGVHIVTVLAFSLAMVVVRYIQIWADTSTHRVVPEDIVGVALNAPRSVLDLLFIGIFTIGIGQQLFALVKETYRLGRGPELGARSAEKAIRRFFDGCLRKQGFFRPSLVRIDALCVLTPEAISAVGGWPGFKDHWTKVDRNIEAELKTIQEKGELAMKLDLVDAAEPGSCVVRIKASKSVGEAGFVPSQKQVGAWVYETHCGVQEIRGRWYLTSAVCELQKSGAAQPC